MESTDKSDRESNAESYLSSLIELTSNSKPMINMLTMLADESIQDGQAIVDVVEQRIAKVEPDMKLPILYLIDSIVKNVGDVYIKYFSQSIVKIFVGAFEKVNEDIRKKMFSLRQTWNDVFPASKLYTLDVKVNQIDPHWPISTQKISPAIHVNPNFFSNTTEKDIQTELQIKQRELLELKKRKLELELAATQKQLVMTSTPVVPVVTQPPPTIIDPNKMLVPKDLAKPVAMPVTMPIIMPMIPKPVSVIPQQVYMPVQMPTRSTTRIAPVNPSMVNSVRLRDPRLARQTPQSVTQSQIVTSQPSNEHHVLPKISSLGPIPRINHGMNSTNYARGQRIPPNDSMPYKETTNKAHTNNDSENKGPKHKNLRSPTKSSSKSSGKSNNSSSSSSKSKSSSSSSSSKSSTSKSDRNSRSSSNSSSSKKSKNRKDSPHFGDDGPKDIDLRVGMIPGIASTGIESAQINESNKRLSNESDAIEPKAKKTKSEKIDILFGTEDVDLRIPPVMNTITPTSLPVAATNNVDAKSLDGVELKTSNVGDQTTTTTTTTTSVAKKSNRDIDLRLRPDNLEENSDESNDKFKMILMQAQEQVENNEVDQEQIESMVQQLKKLKSDSDARKSFKRAAAVGKSSKNADGESIAEVFSSGSEDEALKQSHRVPYKRRRQDNDRSSSNATTKSTPVADAPAPQKERRPRKTKWNSPWEESKTPIVPIPIGAGNMIAPFAQNQPAPQTDIDNRNMRQFSSRNVPGSVWQPNVMPFNCNPVNPILLNNSVAPSMIGNAQIVMAQHGSSLGPCTAKDRTINIDGVPREIRFYGETAIAFMEPNGREPKEIGFQSGERRVCVDNNESIVLAFNDSYKPFVINGQQYSIRFGTPTRELYIDNEWYECFFGDPAVGIVLNNNLHSFHIDGPAPQVRIGNVRTDLVVGKIDMYVDTQTKISLFLDSQVQMFQINNQMHSIQFADYFLSVIIDNIPFPVKYGAMPVKFQLANSDHYIRFSVLPNNIVAGEIYVQNMKRTELQPNLIAPLPTPIVPSTIPVSIPSLMSIVPNSDLMTSNSLQSAKTNQPVISDSSNPTTMPMDINDLFQKLLATGIINKQNKETSPNKEKKREKLAVVDLSKPETLKKRHPSIVNALYSGIQCSSCGIRFPFEETAKYSHHLDWHFRENRRERDSARRAPQRKLYLPLSEWLQYQEIENEEEREKSWFETQQTEMDSTNEESNQRTASPPPSCVAGPEDNNKACDMCHDPFETFYNEETEEWHLRNAVRVEENIYHPICYEDFKASLTLDESHLNASNLGDIPTDDNAVDLPIKQEEELASICLTNSNDRIPILDDDDDVIVLPQEEPVIEEIEDDDDHQAKESATKETSTSQVETEGEKEKGVSVTSQESGISTQPENEEDGDANKNNESDVQILEPQISILNLDEYEETNTSLNASENTELLPVVKIKQEPKYEGYEDDEDDGFEEVGTFEANAAEIIEEASVEDSAPLPPIQTQPKVITSLDGNIEMQDAQPITTGTNKIKINISTNVQLNKNSINSSESVDNNLAINNKELADGRAAGHATNKSVVANDTDRCENGTTDASATFNNNVDAAASDSTEIEYEVKDSIKHVQFKRQPVVRSGLETSGLCSIM